MSLQTFFIRGVGAAVTGGILGYVALALVLPSHNVVRPPQLPASQAEASAAPAQTPTPRASAPARQPAHVAAPPVARSASVDGISLPPSAPPTAAAIVSPATRVAHRVVTQAAPTAPKPPAHTQVHHVVSKAPVAGSTSGHKKERIARASMNGTGSIEPPPVRPPAPPSPYATYDPEARSPYEMPPWYYRRLY